MLAPWIIGHFPPHHIYTEAYGGAASVLLRKPRSAAEVYNDLDEDAVNLFRVLQDQDGAARLRALLEVTPFARAEFERAYVPTQDPIERARRLIIIAFMGFGSNSHNHAVKTGFRANSNKSGTTPAHDWTNYADALPALVERLRGVIIERRPALEVLEQHDSPRTLHYVDPPYVHSTRNMPGLSAGTHKVYKFEMTDADHRALAAVLHRLRGGGSPQRLPVGPLRRALRGLAPRAAHGPRGRRPQAHRGPLAQPGRRGGAGPAPVISVAQKNFLSSSVINFS
jgi:DNA adenine methylase